MRKSGYDIVTIKCKNVFLTYQDLVQVDQVIKLDLVFIQNLKKYTTSEKFAQEN